MEEIERERARADRLLHAILPPSAVAELKARDCVTPRRYEQVAVLFGDIVSFTLYCERHPAEEVVANLDRLTRACEELGAAHGLEKIKSVGDGVVATANLLQPHADPVLACVRCAFAMAEAAEPIRPAGRSASASTSACVVAGVVGQSKFTFDVFGDTVECGGAPGRLRRGRRGLSERRRVAPAGRRVRGQPLGPVALKGRARSRSTAARASTTARRVRRGQGIMGAEVLNRELLGLLGIPLTTITPGHAEVRIGLAAPLTGTMGGRRRSEAAAEVAVVDLNAKAAALGEQMELITVMTTRWRTGGRRSPQAGRRQGRGVSATTARVRRSQRRRSKRTPVSHDFQRRDQPGAHRARLHQRIPGGRS